MVGMEDGRDCCDHLKPCRKYHYNNFIFKPLTFEELLGPTKQLCYRIMFLEIFELVFVSIVGDFALKKKKKRQWFGNKILKISSDRCMAI